MEFQAPRPQLPDARSRREGDRQAKYAEDFRADGMVFIKLMPSPRPHAKIRSIDASAALAMPGVHGILTAKDLPAPPRLRRPPPRRACGRRARWRAAAAARRCCGRRTHASAATPAAGTPAPQAAAPGGGGAPARRHRRRRRAGDGASAAADAARIRADRRTGLRRRADSRARRDSEELASDAIEKIDVDFEPLPVRDRSDREHAAGSPTAA
jgi:CO/xanthine dehydrogenase Mo-binding subunit